MFSTLPVHYIWVAKAHLIILDIQLLPLLLLQLPKTRLSCTPCIPSTPSTTVVHPYPLISHTLFIVSSILANLTLGLLNEQCSCSRFQPKTQIREDQVQVEKQRGGGGCMTWRQSGGWRHTDSYLAQTSSPTNPPTCSSCLSQPASTTCSQAFAFSAKGLPY